jgi:hypothetical protein
VVECLIAHLRRCRDDDRRALLVIDRAEYLAAPDCELLAALADDGGEMLLQIVFVSARPETWAAASDTGCAELAQRIREHHTLLPFSPVETDSYIRQRLAQADGSPDLFTASASEAVYAYSRGVPRLINRVCDLALVYGSSRNSLQIDSQTMDFVLNDRWGGSQQQPAAAPETAGVPRPALAPQPAGARPPGAADAMTPGVTLLQPASTDVLLAQKLVELLKPAADNREPAPRQVSERDLYDFIRLSLRYHQRHVERFTLGIVVGVALLAAGGLWTVITWQNDELMPSAAASYAGSDRVAVGSANNQGVTPVAVAPLSAPAAAVVRGGAGQAAALSVPVLSAAGALAPPPSTPTPGGPPAVTFPPPAEPATLTATIDSESRALRAESARLERQHRRLQKELAAQRAEQERLKQETAAERERAEQARLLVEEARKSARAAWDQINTGAPDAFPEE